MKKWQKWLVIGLLAIIAMVIALSFHQPPVRLMPTPKGFLTEMPNAFAANPALAKSNRIEFFYATNRLPVGPRINRLYAVVPGRDLHLGVGSILIGTEDTSWDQIYALSTGQSDDRRPTLRLESPLEMASVTDDLALVGARSAAPRLGEIYHAAPDAETRDFVDDLNRYATRADRVTVAANMGDLTLRISGAVNRASPAGRPDMAELSPEAADFLLGATVANKIELVSDRSEIFPTCRNDPTPSGTMTPGCRTMC